MSDKIFQVLSDIEALDVEIANNGLPDFLKEKWGVENNVGLWIIDINAVNFIKGFIKEHHIKSILEIGTSVAYSTIHFAQALQETSGSITSIEKSDFKYHEAENNVQRTNLQNIHLIHGDASLEIPKLENTFDLAFIDGNKRGYLPQLKLIEQYLPNINFIIADNIIDMSDKLQDFINYIMSSESWQAHIIEIGDGLLVAQKIRP